MSRIFKHKENTFVAWILRLKVIFRWPLMHNQRPESCSSHSFEVAVIAHNIALIGVNKFNRQYSPAEIAVTALYHESSESAGVSDIPYSVKYANPKITSAIKELEKAVEESLINNSVPDYLKNDLSKYVIQENIDSEIKAIVKASDNISALIKTNDELFLSNKEFLNAHQTQMERVKKDCEKMPEVREFFENLLPSCLKGLDGLV